MKLTLRSAAQQVAVSKSTILRAIQSGRLSAARTDDGGWAIDPAELFRVYPPKQRNGAPQRSTGQDAPSAETGATDIIDAQIQALREMLRRADARADDLKADRDAWREQAERAQRLLADQTPRRRWLGLL